MKSKVRVFIVDDHPVFRAGLREVIESDKQFCLAGEAADGAAASAQIRLSRPDVAVLDIHLPDMNGLDLLRSLRALPHPPAVMVLTMHDEESTFNAAMDAGAQGFILKENAISDVLVGLKAMASGGIFISPSIASHLVRRHQRVSALKQQKKGLASLTPTERRVLRLVAENKTNKEIGCDLFISHRTVETHRTRICEKLELSGTRALLKFAFEHKSEV